MDATHQTEQGSPVDLRRNLLGFVWKAGVAIAVSILILLSTSSLSWPWISLPIAWAVSSLLARQLLRRDRYHLAAWVLVILDGIGVCLPPLLLSEPDPKLLAAEALWKGLPFTFLLLILLAGVFLPPWSTLVLLGLQALLVAWPVLRGSGVDALHLIALALAGTEAGLVWAALGPLFGALGWTPESRRQVGERAEELRVSRDELQRSLQIRDTLNDELCQASAELTRRTTQLQAVAKVSQLVTALPDLEQMLPQVVQLVHDQLKIHVALFLMDESSNWAVLHAVDESARVQEGYRLEANEQTAVGWCAVHKRSHILPDVRAEILLYDHLLPDSRSEAALPLRSRSGVIGVLDVQSPQVGAFGEGDEVILTTIADLIANAITTTRSTEETHRTLQSLRKLQRRYVGESWERFVPQLEASGYRWTRKGVSRLGHRPLPEVSRAVSAERTVAEAEGLVAPISLPGGQVIGALGLHDPDHTRQWTDDDIALVESVASQMAMALENARLFQDAQDRLVEITALHKRYLRESYQDFVPTRSQLEYSFAQPGVSPQVTLPQEIEHVLAENRSLTVVKDTAGGLESILLAPIPLREYVFGALGLQEEGENREWSEDDLALIDAVTEQMAMAIENARLFEETERRAAELQRIAEELRETDKFRAQFLANMSHELRTPLNSIIGFSRVILKGIDGPLTDLQKTDLEAIYSNGQHLLQMINDILDVSKIEAGKMELVIENVDMNVLIKGVISTSNALVRDKPVEFRTEIEPDLPVVRADGTRLRQVITNLVGNAAKFTRQGSITLRAWRDEEMVYVSVADTGEGIAEDKMPLVFEAFRQVDSSSTRRAEGTGLGLPISREFIEMHGGRIWVRSQVGVGSTFTFCVPVEGPVEEVPQLADLAVDESKRMLLVIERDESEFSIYERALEGDGYQVVGLYDGREAVRWARYLRPWAVLMDVQLEADLGWEALESLKSSRATRDVPVIVCSALAEGGRAISMGATAHLPKPLIVHKLLETLARLQR